MARVVGPGLKIGRTDEGVDYGGAGPVYAVDTGRITRLQQGGTGWPGFGSRTGGTMLVYSADSLNQYVYVAEDFLAKAGLHVGSVVHKGDVLGVATGGSSGIEMGYSSAQGVPLAHSHYSEGDVTVEGQAFRNLIDSITSNAKVPVQFPAGRGGPQTVGPTRTDPVSSAVDAVAQKAKDAAEAAVALPKFLGKLSDPNLWIRILQIVGGSVLFLAGLYLLVKDVGLNAAAPVAKAAASVTPARKVAEAV